MSYFDRDMLLDAFTAEDSNKMCKLMASVDKMQIERDIFDDTGAVFRPLKCTYEVIEDKNYAKMKEEDKSLLAQIYEWVQGSNVEARRGLKYLQKLKKKSPKVPVIYNFMGVAYQTLGKEIKRHHVIKETCKQFPHYVFGKISLAEYQLNAGYHEDIPEVFNHKLQLYMHYPNAGSNPVFHGVEVQSFYTVMGRYFARNQQIAHAIKCYFIVEGADSECPHLNVLAREIVAAETAALIASGFETINKGA
jgi:hypothetical protein